MPRLVVAGSNGFGTHWPSSALQFPRGREFRRERLGEVEFTVRVTPLDGIRLLARRNNHAP
jgi:hypothetical protein